MSQIRRLTAILAADVAGFSRLMGMDEEGTHGDGYLAKFVSVVDAVRCAIEVQRGMTERNASTAEDSRIAFRVGVNLGDIIVEDNDIHGDGVNIAARLEAIAEPGGSCMSEDAYRQVRGKVDAEFSDICQRDLKNIARPLGVYRVSSGSPAATTMAAALPLPDKPSIAVLPFANMSGD